MNIFKKDIQISFTHKVKIRMIKDIKQKFSQYRFSSLVPFYLSKIWFFSSVLAYFASCFIKLPFPFDSNIAFLSFACSGMSFILISGLNKNRFPLLKKIQHNLNKNELEYQDFVMERDFEITYPSIFRLNKEEVQELLVLDLTSDQLRDLNDIIQKQKTIHFKYLEQLSNAMTQEEIDQQKHMSLIEENKQAQSKLSNFLLENEVNDYFNVQQLHHKLKDDEDSLTREKSIPIPSRL